MLSPSQKQDKIVRSTDLDALSCRWNCVQKGYFEDPNIDKIIQSYLKYLQFCEGYTNLSAGRTYKSVFDKKLPIINRGTYLRTRSISHIIEQFINDHAKCQIVSMGGGSDTRVFKLINPNINYVELDFQETTRIKKLTIINDSELSKAVNYTGEGATVGDRKEFQDFNPDLHTENYHLIGLDLRNLATSNIVSEYLHPSRPTLVLSECVLCYLNPEENEKILKFWCDNLPSVSLVIYEPISLNDSFGQQMSENLGRRGINLLTFNHFPTLQSKFDFLEHLDFHNINVTDIATIGGYCGEDLSWIDVEELKRIDKLDLIDEIEEIKLLLLHYCLVYGERDLHTNLSKKWKMSK